MTDQELVKRLLAGEETALKEFIRVFEPRLMRLVRFKAAEEDAREIVQDTLMAAVDALPLFRGRASLFSWLGGIARHEIADFYRKRKLKTIVFSKFEGLEAAVSDVWGPEARLDEKELRLRLKQAMRKIGPKYRQLLQLKYVEELSVTEVAGKLKMSFKAAESGLFRARKAFGLAFAEG